MKKTLLVGVFIALFSVISNAQNKASIDSLIRVVQSLRQELYEADSLNKMFLNGIYRNIDKPRFKIYKTENIYTLLKLDTRTGTVWQVQYRMNDVESVVVAINWLGVVFDSDGWDGRFELYPTKNMHTFIMLDTGTGDTYQVQWSTSQQGYRFVEPLK